MTFNVLHGNIPQSGTSVRIFNPQLLNDVTRRIKRAYVTKQKIL
jgi:hypothetical protein